MLTYQQKGKQGKCCDRDSFISYFLPKGVWRWTPSIGNSSPSPPKKASMIQVSHRLQAYLFGDGNDVKTIVAKVLLDQFGYCAFVTTPINMLLLGWKDGDFSFTLLRQQLNWSFITFRCPITRLSICY